MALSVKPYKGARDFYPADKRLQKYMFAKWRTVCESFGYEEYDAPILEPLDIYLAKTGAEIVNEQTYVFEDRGGRQVVIRPEMTPTVSRMVAAQRQELGYPLRWYSIPNLWRYERPQRGRLREHWQLNVDLFGVQSTAAEAELISLVDAMFKAYGAKPDMYQIRVNHRQLIEYLLGDYLGLGQSAKQAVGKLIDRFAKLSRTDFLSRLDQVLNDKQRAAGAAEKLLAILEAKKLEDLPKTALEQLSAQELKTLMQDMRSSGVTVVFDGSLMRGFDYYTGIVFEVFDNNPDNNRSMLGGGRYDGLVGLFGVAPVPTVGFGWGDVTLANFLEGHKLLPKLAPETDIYLATIGKINIQGLAANLRQAGLNVAVDLSNRKIGDQLKTADKKGIEHALIVGENELATAKFKLKNLQTGDEISLTVPQIANRIKHARH